MPGLSIHFLIGSTLLAITLVVGARALATARSGTPAGMPLTLWSFLAIGLLVVQILIGADLWFRGLRPADGALAWVHALGPVAALLLSLYALFFWRGSRASAYALANLATFVISLVSFGIGEMG